MSLAAYIERLNGSRTRQVGLIDSATAYQYKSRLWNLLRLLPEAPQADSDWHLIVVNIYDSNKLQILSAPQAKAALSSSGIGEVVFVPLSKLPQTFTVKSSTSEFRLSDNARIRASISLEVRIRDAKAFWAAAAVLWDQDEDPISTVENNLTSITEAYLQSLSRANFVASKINPRDDTLLRIHPLVLTEIEQGLQAKVDNLSFDGLQIVTKAQITPPNDSNWIDYFLDQDDTFSPHSLGKVIDTLGDDKLRANFYKQEYSVAFNEVDAGLTKLRRTYQKRADKDIRLLWRYGEIAKQVELTSDLQTRIKNALESRIRMNTELLSHNAYLANRRFIRRFINQLPRIP
ncbi:MAG: hypothetical protein KDE58_36030 [Caldilineaceae bacterium]|nr:hypothetical protein [Caldilineaceae bacterium]